MPFKVTDTQQMRGMTQGGTQTMFYRVWLTTGKGASGSVDVPEEDWNKDKLSEILGHAAELLDLAFGLGK